jgi:hypothetical protein
VEPAEYQEVSILVDSGSQQAPLCSTAVAERLGASGKLTSFALQAGGLPLPIYDVGWCDLGINGRSCRTYFKSAALSPFDVILGESWLKEHRGVLDVPDFLSRPWDAEAPDVGLHALSHPRPPKTSALEVLAAQSPPAVVLLPVCQDIAVFHDGTRFSLPVTVPMAAEGGEGSCVASSRVVSLGVVEAFTVVSVQVVRSMPCVSTQWAYTLKGYNGGSYRVTYVVYV